MLGSSFERRAISREDSGVMSENPQIPYAMLPKIKGRRYGTSQREAISEIPCQVKCQIFA